jgi:hypothetical protein
MSARALYDVVYDLLKEEFGEAADGMAFAVSEEIESLSDGKSRFFIMFEEYQCNPPISTRIPNIEAGTAVEALERFRAVPQLIRCDPAFRKAAVGYDPIHAGA